MDFKQEQDIHRLAFEAKTFHQDVHLRLWSGSREMTLVHA